MSRDFVFFCSPWSAHCCHGKYVAWLLIRGLVTTMVGSRFDSDYRKSHPTPGDSEVRCVKSPQCKMATRNGAEREIRRNNVLFNCVVPDSGRPFCTSGEKELDEIIIIRVGGRDRKRENETRKKQNRKSKLFYVSCDYLNMNNQEGNEDIDLEQMFAGHPLSQAWEHNQPLFPAMLNQNRSHSPTSTASQSDYSSDVESTTSSSFRRRPAKPKIHLSSASFSDLAAKEDEILVLKSNGPVLTSDDIVTSRVRESEDNGKTTNRVSERPDSADSSTSYLNLAEEHIASKYLSDENNDLSPTSEHSKKTLFKQERETDIKQGHLRTYEAFRSNSPTSVLLQPFFSHPMTEEIFHILEKVRASISPKLSRLQKLEDDHKLLAVLQVKLAVLQEEKRQLLNTLKQRRSTRQSMSSNHSSKTSSPLSSPVSFQSENDDAFIIRPSPHRVKANKMTQTCLDDDCDNALSCPLCGNVKIMTQDEETSLKAKGIFSGGKNENSEQDMKNGVNSNVEFQEKLLTHDVETNTVNAKLVETAIGDANVFGSGTDASTETIKRRVADFAIGSGLAELSFSDVSTQDSVDLTDVSSQYDELIYESKSILVGCPSCEFASVALQCSPALQDASFGDDIAEKLYADNETQSGMPVCDKSVSCIASMVDNDMMCGCGFADQTSVSLQASVSTHDFSCGDGVAWLDTSGVSCQASTEHRTFATSPVEWEVDETGVQCNLDKKTSHTIGVGEGKVEDVVCDTCLNRQCASVGVGCYNQLNLGFKPSGIGNDNLCRIDDNLCDCAEVDLCETGVGDCPVDNVVCDICLNRTSESVGCGDGRIDDLLCDACSNRRLESRGCGDDDVNVVLCEECDRKGERKEIGVGEDSIIDVTCDKCLNLNNVSGFVNLSLLEGDDQSNPQTLVYNSQNGSNSPLNENGVSDNNNQRQRLLSDSSQGDFCEEVSKIMANSTMSWQMEQKPVICNYCGNKVDLNDSNLDTALVEMRNNFASYKRNGLQAASGVDNLSDYVNIEGTEDNVNGDDLSGSEVSEEEEEQSIKNDIVDSCKMLQQHLSGEKPLKQQLMLKYLANVENLWFQTVKKKRANAAVVKSYIDLVQSRIPQLLDTIINLADQDGNTALHFALTYKNTGVVSILLDSQECNVDIINKAGYSPIMLAALAGFDSKTDKYVMQRLLRAGDINAKNRETGQTPLMFAVSRGHAGMVDLLLDAGAEINEADNDGSTALMCACENGSMSLVKTLLSSPDCDPAREDHEGSTALSIAMDAKRRDLALLIYGSLNFDARGRIKLTPSKQSLLGLGTRRSPSPAVGKL
ncbi:uncharacterized protein LOC135694483 isoform X2 [Rhopilema esculentum]|uniref:uncharacterized protein LOC135694483 isoform X2 n=1 Tax=Rhopilema esculentum TaxID=499914 RepID=UPI0031D71B67